MNKIWVKHEKNPEKRKDIEQILKNSEKTLDIVRNLVYNIYVDSQNFSRKDFNSPNWAFEEAYNHGQRAVLERLLSLLDFQGTEDDHLLTQTKRKALTDARTRNKNK